MVEVSSEGAGARGNDSSNGSSVATGISPTTTPPSSISTSSTTTNSSDKNVEKLSSTSTSSPKSVVTNGSPKISSSASSSSRSQSPSTSVNKSPQSTSSLPTGSPSVSLVQEESENSIIESELNAGPTKVKQDTKTVATVANLTTIPSTAPTTIMSTIQVKENILLKPPQLNVQPRVQPPPLMLKNRNNNVPTTLAHAPINNNNYVRPSNNNNNNNTRISTMSNNAASAYDAGVRIQNQQKLHHMMDMKNRSMHQQHLQPPLRQPTAPVPVPAPHSHHRDRVNHQQQSQPPQQQPHFKPTMHSLPKPIRPAPIRPYNVEGIHHRQPSPQLHPHHQNNTEGKSNHLPLLAPHPGPRQNSTYQMDYAQRSNHHGNNNIDRTPTLHILEDMSRNAANDHRLLQLQHQNDRTRNGTSIHEVTRELSDLVRFPINNTNNNNNNNKERPIIPNSQQQQQQQQQLRHQIRSQPHELKPQHQQLQLEAAAEDVRRCQLDFDRVCKEFKAAQDKLHRAKEVLKHHQSYAEATAQIQAEQQKQLHRQQQQQKQQHEHQQQQQQQQQQHHEQLISQPTTLANLLLSEPPQKRLRMIEPPLSLHQQHLQSQANLQIYNANKHNALSVQRSPIHVGSHQQPPALQALPQNNGNSERRCSSRGSQTEETPIDLTSNKLNWSNSQQMDWQPPGNNHRNSTIHHRHQQVPPQNKQIYKPTMSSPPPVEIISPIINHNNALIAANNQLSPRCSPRTQQIYSEGEGLLNTSHHEYLQTTTTPPSPFLQAPGLDKSKYTPVVDPISPARPTPTPSPTPPPPPPPQTSTPPTPAQQNSEPDIITIHSPREQLNPSPQQERQLDRIRMMPGGATIQPRIFINNSPQNTSNDSSKRTIRAPARCLKCGGASGFICSSCKLATYCSTKCQTVHWRDHENECMRIGHLTRNLENLKNHQKDI